MLPTLRRAEYQIRYMNVHYPLQAEDPLASQRKAVSLNAIINRDSHHHSSSNGGGGSSSSNNGGELPASDRNLRNHFQFSWNEARGQDGVR